MLWQCEAAHAEHIRITDRHAVLREFTQGILAITLRHPDGDAVHHRKRAPVKRRHAALIALDEGLYERLQFGTGHLALICTETIRHHHVRYISLRILRLQHGAGEAIRRRDQHITSIAGAEGVCHRREGSIASIRMEEVRVSLIRSEDNVSRRTLRRTHLGIEGAIRRLGIILAADHLRDHVLRDREEVVRRDTDVHMVLFHHRAHILQGLREAKRHLLAVAQGILPIADDVLCLRRQHDVQHLDGLFAAGRILIKRLTQCDIEVWRRYQPLLSILIKERLKDGIHPLITEHLDVHRASKEHRKLLLRKHLYNCFIGELQIAGAQPGILDKLCHGFKGLWPDHGIETLLFLRCRIRILGTPLPALCGRQQRGGEALQGLHAGIVIHIIGIEAADALGLEGLAGGHEARVVRRKRDAILLEEAAVHHEAVGIRRHRKPVDTAVLVCEAREIGVIHRAADIGLRQIHEAVLQRLCVCEGETAAGDDIRKSAVFV